MSISQVHVDPPNPFYGYSKWVVSAWKPSGQQDGFDYQVPELQKSFDNEPEARRYAATLLKKVNHGS